MKRLNLVSAGVIALGLVVGGMLHAMAGAPAGTGATGVVSVTANSANIVIGGSTPNPTIDLGSTITTTAGVFSGNVSAASLTDTGLTNGQCLQAGTGGAIQSSGSACGSGGGGSVSSIVISPSAFASTSLSSGVDTITFAHGTDYVDLATSQTLTNKSLTAPTITGSPNLSGQPQFSRTTYPQLFMSSTGTNDGFVTYTTGAHSAILLENQPQSGTLSGLLLEVGGETGCPGSCTAINDEFTVDNSGNGTFTGNLTINGTTLTGTSVGATFANVTDSALSSGNCVQAGTSGILTTVSGACGSVGVSATAPLVDTSGVFSCSTCFVTTTGNSQNTMPNGFILNGGSNNNGGTSANAAIYDHNAEAFRIYYDGQTGANAQGIIAGFGTGTGDILDIEGGTFASPTFPVKVGSGGGVTFSGILTAQSVIKAEKIGQQGVCYWACDITLSSGVGTFTFNASYTSTKQPVCTATFDDTNNTGSIVGAGDSLRVSIIGTGSAGSYTEPWLSAKVIAYTSSGSIDTAATGATAQVAVTCTGNVQ